MTDKSAANFDEVKARLREAVDEIELGMDVPPARLLEIEQQLTGAVQSSGKAEELAELEMVVRDHGSLRIVSNETWPRVELHLWQKRAPVVPATKG